MLQLLTTLFGKPALFSAIIIAITLAGLESTNLAILLFAPIIAITHISPRHQQWLIFISLAVGILCHSMAPPPKAYSMPQNFGCGYVESVQARTNGLAVFIDGHNGKVRLTEKRNLPIMPMPGDSICYEANWYPVYPLTVPGAFNTKAWLKSQELSAYGAFVHWDVYKHRWIPERSFYQLRKWIENRFADFLDPVETGLLMGLLAGDKSGISADLRSDFQRTGLVHVLAISGFHVVLLAGLLTILLKSTGMPHTLVKILAVILLLVYIPVTGASPAVRRAVIMFAVPQIGTILNRQSNALNNLGVALLLIMIPEPSVIWNPGFQLSAVATAGIIIGNTTNPLKSIPEKLKKNKVWQFLQKYILEPTYITLCATLATAPFLVHHFKTLSPFAWFGNIVVVPSISMAMQAGLLALLSPIDFLREHFCYSAKFFLRFATLITRILSDSSGASATVGPFGPTILLLFGTLVVLLPACRKNNFARKYALFCLVVFCGTFAYSGFMTANAPCWKLTTLDIGQGDSHLITTPSGRHFLTDAGDGSQDVIVPYLHHIGVQHLDGLIITHPDLDHYGGAMTLIKTFPIKELWITDCARIEEKDDWQKIIAEAYRRNIAIRDIGRGLLWKENYFQLQFLHPVTQHCTDANRQSIAFRAMGLGHSALLTGDLTTAGEKEIIKTDLYLQSDILKLGHHGSRTSSSRIFLQKVKPQLSIVSSGRHNRFRHPSKQVIQRLDSLGIPYVNTAEKGTIHITFTRDGFSVETMME